jgi:hypothetical protein
MITLDHEQERVLRIVVRAKAHPLNGSFHRQLRWIAITGLSMWRFLRPWHFDRWNRQRIEEQGPQMTAGVLL